MAFQAVPDGIEVVLAASQNGTPVVSVYHVKAPGAITDASLEIIATVFFDWWQAQMQAKLHPSYVLNTITATDISVANGHQFQQVLTTDNAGTISGTPAAGNAAVVLSWRTANTGRSFRGRTYVGGLGEVALEDAQHISATTAGVFASAGAALLDAVEAAGYVLSVLSRVANGVARVTGILSRILSVIVDTKIDSQRRRTAN